MIFSFVDADSFLEVQEEFAKNVVIGFARLDGEVTHISYVNSAESGEPTYTASVKFEPDDTVRLGMTVWVYPNNEKTRQIFTWFHEAVENRSKGGW